jgi:hypothetical protein
MSKQACIGLGFIHFDIEIAKNTLICHLCRSWDITSCFALNPIESPAFRRQDLTHATLYNRQQLPKTKAVKQSILPKPSILPDLLVLQLEQVTS